MAPKIKAISAPTPPLPPDHMHIIVLCFFKSGICPFLPGLSERELWVLVPISSQVSFPLALLPVHTVWPCHSNLILLIHSFRGILLMTLEEPRIQDLPWLIISFVLILIYIFLKAILSPCCKEEGKLGKFPGKGDPIGAFPLCSPGVKVAKLQTPPHPCHPSLKTPVVFTFSLLVEILKTNQPSHEGTPFSFVWFF